MSPHQAASQNIPNHPPPGFENPTSVPNPASKPWAPPNWAGRKLLCKGGDGTEAHFSNHPLPLLGRRARRGVWAGAALHAVPGGGGGSDPNIHGSK